MLYYHQGNGVGKQIAQATAREILRKLGLELAMVNNRTNVRREWAKNFTTPLEKKQDLTLQIHIIYTIFLKPFTKSTLVFNSARWYNNVIEKQEPRRIIMNELYIKNAHSVIERKTGKRFDAFPQAVDLNHNGKFVLRWNIGINGHSKWTFVCCIYDNDKFNDLYEVV